MLRELGIGLICRVRRVSNRHRTVLHWPGRLVARAADFAPVHAAEEDTDVDTDAEEKLADALNG